MSDSDCVDAVVEMIRRMKDDKFVDRDKLLVLLNFLCCALTDAMDMKDVRAAEWKISEARYELMGAVCGNVTGNPNRGRAAKKRL